MQKSDILVIGSGVAGLSFAIKAAELNPNASITILTKTQKEECNTWYAQGGIAAVTDFEKDSFEKHINDTLVAGDGLCRKPIVDIVVKEGRERVDELVSWGADFDKNKDGTYNLGKEGGHSENRVLHATDITGREIENTLLEKIATFSNIKVIENFFVIDLITPHHLGRHVTRLTPNVPCYGAYVHNLANHKIERFLAKVVMLATGGIGHLYANTTNPQVATGDGIAMIYRAKGRTENMEFVQFHPTALFNPDESPNFLISEAVRGFGAVLRNAGGERFMEKYDKRLELAPRDIVARAIDNEMKVRGEDNVFLDCTHLDKDKFSDHFPNIAQKCRSIGIDVFTEGIPVVPAQHYICGGIKTDEWGKTSLTNLFAAGECASTGLHGANRLASNSLLQGLVFGYRSAVKASELLKNNTFNTQVPEWDTEGTIDPKEMVLITQSHRELRDIMGTYVGIVRTDVRLKRAMDRLSLLWQETDELYHSTTISPQLVELRNLITIGYLITRSAQFRKESRGLHYNLDHLQKNSWIEDTLT